MILDKQATELPKKPEGIIGKLIGLTKRLLEIKESFYLSTEESENPGRRILTIIGVKLDDGSGPYNIKIDVPDGICIGEIDSILDWGNLDEVKFKIIEIKRAQEKLHEDDKEYIQVLDFLNNINFSMDINDVVGPDTKIDKDFTYEKLDNNEGASDIEYGKQEAMIRFFAATNSSEIAKNFYGKRELVLKNKEKLLLEEIGEIEESEEKSKKDKETIEEEREENSLLEKIKRFRKKIIIGAVIALIIGIVAIAVTVALSGPLAGVFVFIGLLKSAIHSIIKVVESFAKLMASHAVGITIGIVAIFTTKKIHDYFKKRKEMKHQEKIQAKKDLIDDVQNKIKNLEKEQDDLKKSLASVFELSQIKGEHELTLDGLIATKIACQYLCCHLQGYVSTDKPEGYKYEIDKLNVVIKDPDSAKEFLEALQRHEGGNINKLNIQKITVCSVNTETIKIIPSMLQNNITIIDIELKNILKSTDKDSTDNIIGNFSNKDGINAINKELIINSYLQNTAKSTVIISADKELVQNIITKYGKENLSNIFNVATGSDEQELLLGIRNAAEAKLIKQIDLRNIKIRQDMQYISALDEKLIEEVSVPISIYYLDGLKGAQQIDSAARALIDIYAGITKIKEDNERSALLKRFSGFVKELGVNRFHAYKDQEEIKAKHDQVIEDIILFIAKKDNFLKLLTVSTFEPKQVKLFLANFIDAKDKPDFDKKIDFICALIKEKQKDEIQSKDKWLEAIITHVFHNENKLADVFWVINKEYPKIGGMGAFQAVATKDDMADFMLKTYWMPFLNEFTKPDKKNKIEILREFITNNINSSSLIKNKSMQIDFLYGFSKLKPTEKEAILNDLIKINISNDTNKSGHDAENTIMRKMLLKITESCEMIDAVAAIDQNLKLTIMALNSGIKSQGETFFPDFIKCFFINLAKVPLAPKAVVIIENIFKEIKTELNNQDSGLCKTIQENFNKLATAQMVLSSADFKLKQEDRK